MPSWPVIWLFHGSTSTGRLDVGRERLVLTGRDRTFSFRPSEIEASAIAREAPRRLRGLPVLEVRLATGDTIRIASMGGVGSLQELATLVTAPHAVPIGT